MNIKEVADPVKTKIAYSRRRARAVAEHSRQVLVAGVDAAHQVAAVAAKNITSAVQAQKANFSDTSLPVKARLQKARREAGSALADAKTEIVAAANAGYRSVSDKLVRVTDVTHLEQALENKIRRKAAKAKKTARLAAQA